ncbi:hypothetical protein ACE6H2_022216 [Prunus campanulata]
MAIQSSSSIKIHALGDTTQTPSLVLSFLSFGIYWSTLARDVPFPGLMVMFYEGLKDRIESGKQYIFIGM